MKSSPTKRILFVAPESFPVNGAEAIVNVKLLKVLCEAGYIIDVVSRKRKWTDYPLSELKETGIQLNSLHVVEVDNKFNISTIWLHILTFFTFGIVYKGAHWAYSALQVCKRLARLNNYDVIITKSSPSELVGYWFKKKKNIKWIATWNDPFPMEKYPAPYGMGPNAKGFICAKNLIRVMELFPDYHIFPSDRLRDYMLQYLNVPVEKTRIIAHVSFSEKRQNVPVSGNVLRILHSGNVNYPRNPFIFLDGLFLFLQDVPDASIQVDFLGVLPHGFDDKVNELGLQSVVKGLPPVQYQESLTILQRYHIAMLIEAPCEIGIFLPTKVGDYMQSKKPIFAVSPVCGVLNDLYQKEYVGYFADCNDKTGIKEELNKIYADYQQNKIKQTQQKEEYCSEFIFAQYQEILET